MGVWGGSCASGEIKKDGPHISAARAKEKWVIYMPTEHQTRMPPALLLQPRQQIGKKKKKRQRGSEQVSEWEEEHWCR